MDMTLLEWTEAYVRHRDLFDQRITSLSSDARGLRVRYKDGTGVLCVATDTLDSKTLEAVGAEEQALIVTRNHKENVEFLVKHWKLLAALSGLKIIFANVAKNEKWVLVPHSHNKIAEPESLALGLQAMFEAVPEG
jgi:hypothetical protein